MDPPTFIVREDGFQAAPAFFSDPLDLLANDADGDDDLDLFVQNHHLDPFEMWLGDGAGVLVYHSQPESGLWDNAEVPDLFGDLGAMEAAADAAGLAGLTLWHDVARDNGLWRLRYNPGPTPPEGPLSVDLQTSAPIDVVADLDDAEVVEVTEQHLIITLQDVSVARTFGLHQTFVGAQLIVDGTAGGQPVSVRAGTTLAPLGTGRVSVWMNDPHGVVWGDMTGAQGPELFATRGALTGTLGAPEEPKSDHLWVHLDEGATWATTTDTIPPSYNRGRQVALVDTNEDDVAEIHIGCEASANQMLRLVDGVYVDVAAALGLHDVGGDTSTWFDVDSDGDEDLIWLDLNVFRVSYNQGDAFTQIDGDAVGLVFPQASAGFEPDGIFDDYGLVPADMDGDGDLDLWFYGHGVDGRVALYRQDGSAFTDVTEDMGMSERVDVRRLLPTDLDLDGLMDAVLVGDDVSWLRQNPPGVWVATALDARADATSEVVVGDFTGDGWPDVARVGATTGRTLLVAVTPTESSVVVLAPGPGLASVASIVRATRASGRVSTFRYGSHANTWISQVLSPLAVPGTVEDPIVAIRWTWPDGVDMDVAPIAGLQTVGR